MQSNMYNVKHLCKNVHSKRRKKSFHYGIERGINVP